MAERPIVLPAESPERRAERVGRIAAFLAKLDASKPWQLVVQPWKRERTPRQNNAMFGVAYKTLSDFTGFTEVELHDLMLKAFFGEAAYELMGVSGTKPLRTTTTNEEGERDVLPREKFSEFYDFIVRKAAEIGCYIEDPNPQLRTRAA